MRATVVVLSLFPSVLVADIIPLTSEVSAVTLYPQGAHIVREVPFEMPAGRHEFVLKNLPASIDLSRVSVEMTGAMLGAVTGRAELVPPQDDQVSAQIAAAKAEVERLEEQLRRGDADVDRQRLAVEASAAQVAFLRGLGGAEQTVGMEAAALRELAQMIGDEVLAARQAGHAAELAAAAADRALEGLRAQLEAARRALAALQTEDKGVVQLSITASSQVASEGVITLSYLHQDAGWTPTYDMRLDKMAGRLGITRGATIWQGTGEDWEAVALTLSTVRPSAQIAPHDVLGWPRFVVDPQMPQPLQSAPLEMSSLARQGRMADTGRVVAEAEPHHGGLAVSYSYPEPVRLANRADSLQIALGTGETPAEVLAWAAPLYDDTGFMMASIINDTGEILLPTPFMRLYLDGRYMGQSRLRAPIPVGAEADLPFGAIEGLRLARTVTRNEGERGVISRSTELSEEVKIEVENLTGELWPVMLFDRVPYSEQEELDITWSASPRPNAEDFDDRQGVLNWSFDLKPGAKQAVTLGYELAWPEGKILQ